MFINAAKATEAASILEIKLEDLTEETIKAAYRTKARAAHPDAGGSAEQWARVSWAEAALKRWLTARPMALGKVEHMRPGNCRACAGTGRVRSGQLKMFCVLCDGTGNTKARDND